MLDRGRTREVELVVVFDSIMAADTEELRVVVPK